MLNALRGAGLVLLAVAAGAIVVGLVEFVGHSLLMPGAVLLPEMYPSGVYAIAVLALGLGTALSVHLIARFRPRHRHRYAMGVTAIFAITALLNMTTLPHPGWSWPAAALALLFGCWSGLWSALQVTTGGPSSEAAGMARMSR